MDISPEPADAASAAEQGDSGWWPLDCLRSLGRAASIAAGAPSKAENALHGFSIVVVDRDGAYYARITHHRGKAIRLSRLLRHQLDGARFQTAEEAQQHARFLIASGALRR